MLLILLIDEPKYRAEAKSTKLDEGQLPKSRHILLKMDDWPQNIHKNRGVGGNTSSKPKKDQ